MITVNGYTQRSEKSDEMVCSLMFANARPQSKRIFTGESRLGELTQNGQNVLSAKANRNYTLKTVLSRVCIPPKMPFGQTTIAEYRSIDKLIYHCTIRRLNIFKQLLPGSEDTKLIFFQPIISNLDLCRCHVGIV